MSPCWQGRSGTTPVGLTSTQSTGSGTKLLERGWTFLFWICPGCEAPAGVGILTSPRLSAAVLEFSPVNEKDQMAREAAGQTW